MANFNNPFLSYNNFPYGQFNPNTMAPFTMQPQSSEIRWVQGEAAAKAYPIAPNGKILLMDSENACFYIKTADANGIPSIEIYDYVKRPDDVKIPIYVTQEQMDKIVKEVDEIKQKLHTKPHYEKKGGQRNA